jgi:hypothetical protein
MQWRSIADGSVVKVDPSVMMESVVVKFMTDVVMAKAIECEVV